MDYSGWPLGQRPHPQPGRLTRQPEARCRDFLIRAESRTGVGGVVSPLLRQNHRSMGNGAGSRLSTRRGGEFNAFRPGGSHRTRGLRRARHRDRAGVTTSAIRAATAYVGSGRASQEGFVDLAYICRAGAAGLPLGRGRVPSVQGRRPGLVQLTAKDQGRHRCAWHNIGSRGAPQLRPHNISGRLKRKAIAAEADRTRPIIGIFAWRSRGVP